MTDDQVAVRAVLKNQAQEFARVVGTVTVISESMSRIFSICDFNRVKESWSASAHESCEFILALSARLHQSEQRVKRARRENKPINELGNVTHAGAGRSFHIIVQISCDHIYRCTEGIFIIIGIQASDLRY
jgi:hypothetical protein